MFIGEYHHTLDDKGRLAVPVKFRVELAKGAVVTRGLDSCLFLLTGGELDKLAAELAAGPLNKSKMRAYARHMLAGAMEATPDKQGRIMVPDHLRRFAGLKKDVVVAGLYNRIEIWDKAAWEAYTKQNEAAINDIAEQLGEIGM
ncbi:MAG: division/cell wall cluster transcriptional repressor MraZ [Patescibacteria group bacterium]